MGGKQMAWPRRHEQEGSATARAARRLRALVAFALATALHLSTAEARLVVHRIVVHGETKTTLRALSSRMNLHPGDSIDFAAIGSAEHRLEQSGLFTAVRVYLDMPTDEAARRM